MSTKPDARPACEIASVVAMKVLGTVTTTSPGSDAGRDQGEPQRVRAAVHADAVLGVAELGEVLFEIPATIGPANEARRC